MKTLISKCSLLRGKNKENEKKNHVSDGQDILLHSVLERQTQAV